jgi:hypothetical protein
MERIWKEAVAAYLRDYLGIFLDRLRKTLNQDVRCRGPDFDPKPPEYEAGVHTARCGDVRISPY